MIERAIAVLKQVGFDLTSEEMADILWLATHLDQTEPDTGVLPTETPVRPSDPDPTIPSSIPSGGEPQKAAKVYPPSTQNSPKKIDTVGSVPIKIPAATALPDALNLGRSLRPLMRKVSSSTYCILDEEATVRRIVEQKIWLPVLKAAPTRWLELALVIEHTSSTAVWQPTLRELQHLLEHHGAFRDVRTWQLIFDGKTPKLWTKNRIGEDEKRFHSPRELLDSSRKRLILLVSDCISPAWYNKTIYPLLRLWGSKGMVSVLQLLPENLWYRTALELETYVQIRSLSAGVPNTQLKATNWEGEEINNPFKLPVITLEPDSLYNWSQVIAGNGSVTTTGIVLTSDFISLPEEEDIQLSPLQRVSRFRATASPTAQKLAGLLAATPISLPIVHLIGRKMLPKSRQIHVAEVFMSGLLEPIQTERKLEYQEYEFIAGVRKEFIASVPRSQSTDVIYQLSEYIAERLGLSINEFEARLLSPQIASQDSSLRPFATITAQVLRQLGGECLDFAQEIESYLNYSSFLENSRHLLGQYGNTKIYSLLTDSPWLLPFDALVIPYGRSEGFGTLGRAFRRFLGRNDMLFLESISREVDETASASLTFLGSFPDEVENTNLVNRSFLVRLPPAIIQQLAYNNPETDDRFVICVDSETRFPEPKSVEPATKSIINLAIERKLPRLIVPLLGTVKYGFSVAEVATIMLQAISTEIQSLPSNPVQEITFVNKDRTKYTILNQVAQRLFPQTEPLSLSSFSFETVTVNRRGKIIKRENHTAQYFTEILPDQIPLEMVYIPGGTFLMGSPEGEGRSVEGRSSERPQHEATVPAFFMGKYPITQAQWKAIASLDPIDRELEIDPSHFQGNNRPVERVSWYDAVEFCKRLSKLTGKEYRLPSEAEWEYACRAVRSPLTPLNKGGISYPPFYFGETITGELANYRANHTYADEPKGEYRGETTSVGQFPSNTCGLYDMHGNVWEWCLDDWHDSYENAPTDGSAWLDSNDNRYQKKYNTKDSTSVLRGGSWISNPDLCRSAFRISYLSRNAHLNDIGFRVVCSVG